MKNVSDGLISRLDMAEQKLYELNDIPKETSQAKIQRNDKEWNNVMKKDNTMLAWIKRKMKYLY